MEQSAQLLSDIIVYSKYARYLPKKHRRETWEELITRNMQMHLRRFPSLKSEIEDVYKLVYDKSVIPSARSLQFAGKPIEIAPSRIYNCCFVAADHWKVFGEIMFLLLGGTGAGYSVQSHHVAELPPIRKPIPRRRRHLVGDSIEGWAEAINVLMEAYFYGKSDPVFDYSDVREKGALLVTSGGRAPGPQPLEDCLYHIRAILSNKSEGSQLRPIEVHDIITHIADAVLSGGIRRASLIALFSIDDEEMLTCKLGNELEKNPHRRLANNSVVALRHRFEREDFDRLWSLICHGRMGEPGIILSNNMEMGYNPCAEASLKSKSFCNLTTMNVQLASTQEELERLVRAAAFLGTLQASYTDFHFLREGWQKVTEKDALLGVSMTGIAGSNVHNLNLKQAAKIALQENDRVAKLIGINNAARVTLTKPEGTCSLVCGTSSGIHAWEDQYLIRRVRLLKNESLYQYVLDNMPELVEDDHYKPSTQAVLSIPIKAPDGAILRKQESAIDFLKRVQYLYKNWVVPGHRRGDNTHNVSATVYLSEPEWDEIGNWLWENRDSYNGLSFFPRDEHKYPQAPLEGIDKDTYETMYSAIKNLDLKQVTEIEDSTSHKQEPACAGGACLL